MKRMLSMGMTLMLLLSILSGCGETSSASPASAAPEANASEAPEAPPAPAEESAVEEPAPAEAASTVEETGMTIEENEAMFPLEENVSYTI